MNHEPLPLWALAGGALALAAIGLELSASLFGQGESTSWPGFLQPIAWPTAVRVVWWLAAGAGAVAANVGLARADGKPRPVRTVFAAAPFVGFAVAIAFGLEIATWH